MEQFKALVGMVETYGGAYGHKPGLVATELVAQGINPEDVANADHAAIIKAEEVCCECYLSCMLLPGTNNGRYHQFKVDLSNNMMKGTDNYLKTMVETMRMLTDYVPPPRLQRVRNPDGKGLAFIQDKGSASLGPKKDINIVADHTTRANASSSCWTWASRTSASMTATRSTTCSRPMMGAGSFRNRHRECKASFPPTTHTSTHVQANPALPIWSFSQT